MALATLSLLLIRLLADLAWRLVGRWVDPLVERSRSAQEHERVRQRLAAGNAARERLRREQQQLERQLRLTDLEGRPLCLRPDDVPAFQNRCCRELGLPPGSTWARIRQQWRRQSLRWHPDHGGSTAEWLRKQRAYEALRLLQGDTRRWRPAPLPPLLAAPLGGRRRWGKRRP